ncbi:MAG TPA: FAD-dependent oxidoreductase [Pelobium sp.]|nr:FAD-dependent oxidoreductase [Pelobium sp.]
MIKQITFTFFFLLCISVSAQYKPDVIVVGGSAAGTAAAMQAATSGVKVLLIEPSNTLIGDVEPSMDIPNFNHGIWKQWRDAYEKAKDSAAITPQNALENLVKNTKRLTFLKGVSIEEIEKKNNGWALKVLINGKIEKIKSKILVDATTNSKNSLLVKNNILKLDSLGKFDALVNYSKQQMEKPYQQVQKLYKTSGAAGFGKDSTLHYIPLGIFIPREVDNLLIVSMSCFKDFETEDLRNIALWTNIGQAAGALAAYGPFFDVSPKKASIRITQNEMIDYKSFLYPVLDIKGDDIAWYPIQKIIASGVLHLDFSSGKFNPDSNVKANDIKGIMAQLYPRSRIWFIENKNVEELSVGNIISLLSFVSGRDPISLQQEVEARWKDNFKSDFNKEKPINKRELACLLDHSISPYNVNVDFAGFDLR